MIRKIIAQSKGAIRIAFTALSVVLMLNVSSSFAQNEMNAFSYVDQNTLKSVNARSTLPSAQANSANATEDQGVETWGISLNGQLSDLIEGDTLQIPLPSGKVLSAIITVRKEFKNGDVQLMAGSDSGSRIILTIGSNVAFGSIVNSSDNVNYSISLDRSSSQVLIDQDTLPEGSIDFTDDFIEVDLSNDETTKVLETTAQNVVIATDETSGKTNIDVLFVYSSEFEALFDSAETRINQLIAFTNQAYDDTGILINLRAVSSVELESIENDDSVGTLLTAARGSLSNDGLGDVAELRDEAGADLVAVLTTSVSNFSSNGVAFVGGNRQDLGFSSTKLGLFCCDIVFAHEIGHNLGSGHQRQELNLDGISPCTGGFTGFSCGHANIDLDINGDVNRSGTWGTIMASGGSIPRRNLFSNLDPTLTSSCGDNPCGVAEGQSGAADNLSSFNFTRIAISQFRDEIIQAAGDDNFLLEIIPAIIRAAESSPK